MIYQSAKIYISLPGLASLLPPIPQESLGTLFWLGIISCEIYSILGFFFSVEITLPCVDSTFYIIPAESVGQYL